MITILADHNVEGHADLLLGALRAAGWAKLLEVRIATFKDVGLAVTRPDREVWRRAQDLGMLLLTANRRKREAESLEQTLREEHNSSSLPVLTISNSKRFSVDREYRKSCADRVAEILVYLERYQGTPRLYVP